MSILCQRPLQICNIFFEYGFDAYPPFEQLFENQVFPKWWLPVGGVDNNLTDDFGFHVNLCSLPEGFDAAQRGLFLK